MRPFVCTHLCIVFATVLTGAVGCTNGEPVRSTPQANTDVESGRQPIRLLDLDGKSFNLWKPEHVSTVVVFTRSDCPVSNRFAPEIRRLHEAYHQRGVNFYLVYVDPREQPAAIRRHLQEYEYPCEGLRDPEHALVAHCQATTTPEAVVFDRNRRITYRGRINDLYADLGSPRTGPTTHDLADAIESTVLGLPVATPRTKAIGCRIGDVDY